MDEISKEMILDGLQNDVIHICKDPFGDFIAAWIGDFWFYFAGEDDELTVEEYLEKYSLEDISQKIHSTINDEPIKGDTEEDSSEWLYYRAVLLCNTERSFIK